jgi:hypothetical protein
MVWDSKVLLKLDIQTVALIKLNRQPIQENKLSEVTNEYSLIVPLHLIHSYKWKVALSLKEREKWVIAY